MKITFVILNYIAYGETIACLNSINRFMNDIDEYYCVIVDNGSPEQSYRKLEEQIASFKNVKLIRNENNLGFARGNNVGIKFAREYLHSKFIACINSDILLMHTNILQILEREYEDNKFAVLGPLVVNSNGRCDSNPVNEMLSTPEDVKRLISRVSRELYERKTGIYKIKNIIKRCNILKNEKTCIVSNRSLCDSHFDVKLHGCALFFSPTYFEVFNGFDESTFLYLEEDFLRYHLKKNNMISEYCPQIIVYHNEHASTKKSVPNFIQMLNFRDTNVLNSANKLLELMERTSD